jgi:hypothetical protein
MPTDVQEVRNPVAEIMQRKCEIRFVPDLWSMRANVMRSTLEY